MVCPGPRVVEAKKVVSVYLLTAETAFEEVIVVEGNPRVVVVVPDGRGKGDAIPDAARGVLIIVGTTNGAAFDADQFAALVAPPSQRKGLRRHGMPRHPHKGPEPFARRFLGPRTARSTQFPRRSVLTQRL